MSELKPTVEERLDAILGVEREQPKEVATIVPSGVPAVISSGNPEKDFNDDFDVVRSTMHSLIAKGAELTDAANYVAKEKQDARSIEAAAMAQKEARDSALALLDAHQKKADIKKGTAKGDTNIQNQNNVAFIGTTGDLLRYTRDLDKNGLLQDTMKILNQDPNIIDVKEESNE